jgi:hypothetical protein
VPAAALPLGPRIALVAVGVVVLFVTAGGVVRVLIVPRPPAHGLSTLSMRLVRRTFRRAARIRRTYAARDALLVLSEPVALVALLVSWMALTVVGFALLLWGDGATGFAAAFDQAGSSVFTLGGVSGHQPGAQIISFVAAGAGLTLVALEIAYLPALYGSYNRRETLVTLLESRAGAPAWGPEILARHHLVGLVGNLPALFADWERWAADVAESHTSYPSLLYFRSPRARNSWVISLLAVMDAAALMLAIDPEGAPMEARMCVRMGFTALRDIAHVAGVAFDPDPDPDGTIELPRSEFEATVDHLVELGYTTSRARDEMWMHFRGWRVNYETVTYELARVVDAPPATWSGPRDLGRGGELEPERPVDRQPRHPDGDRA